MRDQMPEEFLICFADTFERVGVAALRAAMTEEPAAYAAVLRRVVSPQLAERIEGMGAAVPDGVLEEVARRAAEGIRRGTAAEGKPARSRLN